MRIRSATALAAVLLAVATMTSGCVIHSGSADAGGNDVGSAAINPQPRSALRDGGNLRVAITESPENFNTNEIDGNSVDMAFIAGAVLPGSFVADAAGTLSVNHDYFTDIKLLPGSPQQVVFTINPKAVWSDGAPITWDDLQSEANAMSGRDTHYLVSTAAGFNQVTSVTRGIDDHQAILTFSKPYNGWIGLFSPLYPKSITATPEAFNTADRDSLPISSGPFKITSIDKVQGRVTLTRDPRWWGEKPKLDSITCIVLDPDTWVPALQNNEIDATDYPINSLSQVKAAKDAADIEVRRAPDPSAGFLTFNGAQGAILDDSKLRLAISKAINRSAIARALQFGLTDNPVPLNNHVYLAGQPGYQDNSAPIAFDPTEAAKELDALGWTRDRSIRAKAGRHLEIHFATEQTQTATEIAEIVQQNLADVGVKLDIESHPQNGFFENVVTPGNFDIADFVWSSSDFPLVALNQVYSWDPGNVQANYGHIGNSTINDLIEQAGTELDPNKAMALANVIDRKLFEEGFSIPLYQSAGNYPVRSNLANYGAFGLATVYYTKMGFLK